MVSHDLPFYVSLGIHPCEKGGILAMFLLFLALFVIWVVTHFEFLSCWKLLCSLLVW